LGICKGGKSSQGLRSNQAAARACGPAAQDDVFAAAGQQVDILRFPILPSDGPVTERAVAELDEAFASMAGLVEVLATRGGKGPAQPALRGLWSGRPWRQIGSTAAMIYAIPNVEFSEKCPNSTLRP
jgi:hypothetical protein